jgi:hypothetical protein
MGYLHGLRAADVEVLVSNDYGRWHYFAELSST